MPVGTGMPLAPLTVTVTLTGSALAIFGADGATVTVGVVGEVRLRFSLVTKPVWRP